MLVFLVGLIASIIITLMAFSIQRKSILILSVLTGVFTTIQYALLGENGTALLTTISLVYALALCFSAKFPIVESKWVALTLMAIFTTAFIGVNGFSISWSFVSYVASLIGAFMLLFKNQLVLKWMMLLNGLSWATFQLVSGAYGQLPGEVLFITGVVFSLVVMIRAEKRGQSLDDVPEFSTVLKNLAKRLFGGKRKADSTQTTSSTPNLVESTDKATELV